MCRCISSGRNQETSGSSTVGMTGLFPGFLFPASGLNRMSAPGSPIATSGLNRMSAPGSPIATVAEVQRTLQRGPLVGRPWPQNRPVSRVYDACNSSTCLIILNNKLSTRPKGSRLRGETDITGEIMKPDPKRHTHQNRASTMYQYHQRCTELNQREITLLAPAPPPARRAQNSSLNFANASRANPTHHVNSLSHQNHGITEKQDPAHHAGIRTSYRDNKTVTSILGGVRISQGDRVYLNSIAEAYSIDDIRRGKQLQCNALFWHVIKQGGYSLPDLLKYSKYLLKPNKNKHRPHISGKHKRCKSAPDRRTNGRSYTHGDGPSPNTDQTKQESKQKESREQTDTTSPNSKTTINSNKMSVQRSKEKTPSLSERPSSDKSLLSLVLEMSNTPTGSRLSDEIKTGRYTEDKKQNNDTEEREIYDINKTQRSDVDNVLLIDGENHTDENEDDESDINDEIGHLDNKGKDMSAYRDFKNTHGDKISVHEIVTNSDTEKYALTYKETQQFESDNEEIEEGNFQELSLQVLQEHSQEIAAFQQKQTEQVPKQQMLSQDGGAEVDRHSILEEDSQKMANEQMPMSKEDQEELRQISEMAGENVNSDWVNVFSGSSREEDNKPVGRRHQETGADRSDESDPE